MAAERTGTATNAARAVVNILRNSVATIVVAKWEGTFDAERARSIFLGKETDSEAVVP